jgi:hypothetical protein
LYDDVQATKNIQGFKGDDFINKFASEKMEEDFIYIDKRLIKINRYKNLEKRQLGSSNGTKIEQWLSFFKYSYTQDSLPDDIDKNIAKAYEMIDVENYDNWDLLPWCVMNSFIILECLYKCNVKRVECLEALNTGIKDMRKVEAIYEHYIDNRAFPLKKIYRLWLMYNPESENDTEMNS